jgi:hypothetical protein
MQKILFLVTFLIPLCLLPLPANAQRKDSVQDEKDDYKEWQSSQNEYINFDISKYITPDIVRNQLAVNVHLNSDYAHVNSDNERYVYRVTSTDYNFMGTLASNFSRYTNTRRRISDLIINLSLDKDYTSQKHTSIYSDRTNDEAKIISANNVGLGFKWADKRYGSKLFFGDYDLSGTVSYHSTDTTFSHQSVEINNKQQAFVFHFSPRLGAGYGRMENVEDARQAVYIANALSKKNILKRNLSNAELWELSQHISTVKNKRFLDSRLHLTDEISTVDSFFVKKELLSNPGAAYFATLYDMWQYGALFSRKSGYELSFVMRPRYTYQYSQTITEPQEAGRDLNQADVETWLVFNYEKPVKLNWQHRVEAATYACFFQGKRGQTNFESLFHTNSKMLSAWADYSLGYYPNTRTNIEASLGQQIRKQIDTYLDYSTYTTYTARLNVNVNYYLSPYFRISGSWNLNYEHYLSQSNAAQSAGDAINRFNTLFNIQRIYFIF